jgi:nucleoside-diphosphate-sugar epimerase
MRLLILGGTLFLGRTVAEQAIAAGWQVTTFSRGRSGHDVPGAEAVRGDRQEPSDIAQLAQAGPWDAVVDASGQVPAVVAASAQGAAAQGGAVRVPVDGQRLQGVAR